jgi:Tol biopolymer transport system component
LSAALSAGLSGRGKTIARGGHSLRRLRLGGSFSPDGRRIAFQSNLGGGEGDQIFAANNDGSDVVQVTSKELIFAT